jgi:hypothetical protein
MHEGGLVKGLEGFLEVTFLDALCAEFCLFCGPVLNNPDSLKVRQPLFLCFIIGVAHIVADLFSFST